MRWAAGLLVVVLASLGGYVAYPHWTVYRIENALRAKDVRKLDELIDWQRVRAELKEEIKAVGGRQLASDVEAQIDRNVTPQTLFAYASSRTAFSDRARAIKSEGFVSLKRFEVEVAPDANKPQNRVFVVLELEVPSWRVVKLRLPGETLQYIAGGRGLRPSRR